MKHTKCTNIRLSEAIVYTQVYKKQSYNALPDINLNVYQFLPSHRT